MKTIKILSLLLAVVMICGTALVGCAKGEEAGNKEGVDVIHEETKEDASEIYDAEIHDLHGHEFWFIARYSGVAHLQPNEIYAEELTGDKVNDAVFKRNAMIEEKYNCKIQEERNTNPVNAVREQLIAGEYQYDFIYDSVTRQRSLSASNLLVDFNSLENVDLSKAWWDHNAIEGMSIAGKAFYVTGDGTTMDDRGSWVIYVNRDLVERARLEDPYKIAFEGKWTIDKMYEYMVATQEDLDGNGVWEIGKDRFGYIGEHINNYFHIAAFNIHISKKSDQGDIIIPATVSEELLAAWDALRPVIASHYRDVSDSGGRFKAGLGTFFGCNLGVLTGGNLSAVNFGILPMPKLNEEQEEYWTSPHHTITYGYSIPVTTDLSPDAQENGFDSGREQAGYFLEAFSYWSRQTLTVAFYDQVM
ncbi:MAG: hypothetical protein II776_06445, partial [Clostridia bacterium]|nr:hypothetical protein [Clostridia bacterium]